MLQPISLSEIKIRIGALKPHIFMQEAEGDAFFFAGQERTHPFATLVTRDTEFDHLSKLDQTGFYRVSAGVSRETFERVVANLDNGGKDIDYAISNKIIPNPVYAKMFWLCVQSPDAKIFEMFEKHLCESYDLQFKRTERRATKLRS